MANTFTCLQYHLVFSTKHREPWLRPDDQDRIWAYLGGIARDNRLTAVLVGGMADHVHILLGVPAAIAVSEAVKRIKGGSSGWIKQNIFGCRGFAWQDGYGAFSVSKSAEERVKQYIRDQHEHHRVKTFQEEYRELLHRHGIQFDERYLWG
jgi:REP element-mobilizing transposase RayT